MSLTTLEQSKRVYKNREKEPLITFVDNILAPHGGRLFDGFSLGKN